MKRKNAAACGTAATLNELHCGPYPKPAPLSSLKLFMGELLLFGNKRRKVFWPFFDAALRQYVDLRLASQSIRDKPELKNSH
jgi:hypothetical protein